MVDRAHTFVRPREVLAAHERRIEPIEATIAACQASVDLLDEHDLITVVVFDSRAEVFIAMQPRGDARVLEARLASLKPDGGTDYGDALSTVGDQLSTAPPSAKRRVLFLSDGRAPRHGVVELVARLREQGVTLSTMSLGDEVDVELLDGMAEAGGGRHHRNAAVGELTQAFNAELRHLMALP